MRRVGQTREVGRRSLGRRDRSRRGLFVLRRREGREARVGRTRVSGAPREQNAPPRAARSGTGSPPSTAAPSDPRTPGTVRRVPRTGRSPRWTRRFPTQPPSARNRPLPRLRGHRTPTCSGADPPSHRPAGHPPGSTCPPNPLNLNRVAPTASGARVLQGRARFAYDKAKTRGLWFGNAATCERARTEVDEFSV